MGTDTAGGGRGRVLEMAQPHMSIKAGPAGFPLGVTVLTGEWSRRRQPGEQDTPSEKAVTAVESTSGRGSASVVVTLVQPCLMALGCISKNYFLRTGAVKLTLLAASLSKAP